MSLRLCLLVGVVLAALCVDASPFKYLRSSSIFRKPHELNSVEHSRHSQSIEGHKDQKLEEEAHDFDVDAEVDDGHRPASQNTDARRLPQEWINTHVYEVAKHRGMSRANNVFNWHVSSANEAGYLKGREDLERAFRFEEAPFKNSPLRLRADGFDGMKCTGLMTCSCVHYFFNIPGEDTVLQASYHANAGDIHRNGRPVQLAREPELAKATRRNTIAVIQTGPDSGVLIDQGNIYFLGDVLALVEKAQIPLENIYVITGDSMGLSFADLDGFVSQLPPKVHRRAIEAPKKKSMMDRLIACVTCSGTVGDD